jgi:hypothetical protein
MLEAKELLLRLLNHFRVNTNNSLVYSYLEDTEMRDIDEDLNNELLEWATRNDADLLR